MAGIVAGMVAEERSVAAMQKNLSARDFCQTAAYFGGTMAAALAVSNPVGATAWAFIAATSAYAGR